MNIDKKSISIIRKEYAETVKACQEAEIEYNQNRKSRRAQAIKEWCAAQEMELSTLCRLLDIQLWDEDFNLIEYNEILQEVQKTHGDSKLAKEYLAKHKYTQAEFDAFPVIDGIKQCPTGDYSEIKHFGEKCSFGEHCSFGEWCSFKEHCSFDEHCSFGVGCSFGEGCSFGDYCYFNAGCSFNERCSFGECTFDKCCSFYEGCSFGKGCSFDENCSFIVHCSFSEDCSFKAAWWDSDAMGVQHTPLHWQMEASASAVDALPATWTSSVQK